MPAPTKKSTSTTFLYCLVLLTSTYICVMKANPTKKIFSSGTSAAAAGGFTTVLDMPNNEPITMSVQTLKDRMALAQRRMLVNIGLYSEFPKKLRVQEIVWRGAVGFKLFMGSQIGGLNIDDDEALQDAFKEVSTLKVPVAVHAEDKTLLMPTKKN